MLSFTLYTIPIYLSQTFPNYFIKTAPKNIPSKGASRRNMPTSRSRNEGRHLPAQPVIYRSSTLQRSDPELVATAGQESISKSQGIQNANMRADAIRDSYRNPGPPNDATPLGNDEQSNAKKYERRLMMNRRSAAASRLRREAYTKALEVELLGAEEQLQLVLDELNREKERNKILSTNTAIEQGAVEKIEPDELDIAPPSQVSAEHMSNQDLDLDLLIPTTPQQNFLVPDESTSDDAGQNGFHTPQQLVLPIPVEMENFLNPDPSNILTEQNLRPLLERYPSEILPMNIADAFARENLVVGEEIPDCFKFNNGDFPLVNIPEEED